MNNDYTSMFSSEKKHTQTRTLNMKECGRGKRSEEVHGNKMLEVTERNDNEMSGFGNDTFQSKWLKQSQWQWDVG